jgi:hypothetical protein
MPLSASFVRVRGQRDRIYVHRSDGTEVSWVFPTYGDELPHDMIHLIVESAFAVRRGFWGSVDSGIDPARVNQIANRIGGKDKYRGFGEDSREILLAEALANTRWEKPDMGALAEVARSLGLPPIANLTADRAREVVGVQDRLRARWCSIGAKGAVELVFEPTEAGFARLVAG